MEFLDGTVLEALLHKRGKLPSAEVVDYVMQVCEALAEAHSIGIVHRDMKPANCVLATRHDGMAAIKVLDFGIAKMLMGDDAAKLTATSATMGTPAFMSPEQIRGAKDVDHRGDIWSVGVMLFELIAGHVPFQANTYGLLVKAVMLDPMPPLPGVPPGLGEVVGRCLAKDRNQRYQNIGELAVALQPFAGNVAEATVLAQRCTSLARPPGQRTPPAGVPQVGGGGPATPAHGNYPMQTPAQGMPPGYPLTTPAQGMPQGHPMFTPAQGSPPQNYPATTPAQGMPPGQYPMTTPAHGMPHGQQQHPMFGQQPNQPQMMSTPAHGMPPQMLSTPGLGNPPNHMQTGIPTAQKQKTAPPANYKPIPSTEMKTGRIVIIAVLAIVVGVGVGLAIMFGT